MGDNGDPDILLQLPLADQLHIHATEYQLAGRFSEARETYAMTIALVPEHAGVRLHYGMAFGSTNDTDHALEQYQLALRYDATLGDALREAGLILLSQGRAYEALDAFLRWEDHDPGIPDPRYYAGCALACDGDLDGAIDQFWVALSRQKDIAPSRHAMGIALYLKGDYAKADTEIYTAICVEPNNPFFRFHYGIALDAQGNFDRAVREFRVAIAIDPKFASAAPVLSANIWRDGPMDVERHSFSRWWTLKYTRFWAVYGRAKHLARTNDIVGALNFLREARRLYFCTRALARRDEAFESLRNLAAFQAIINS